MGETLAQKIIRAHLLHGDMTPGSEIALRIDQTLTQDATGTMAYLEFETMGIPRVRTELSVAYVDHNTLQSGFENADDHRYLQTVAKKHGVWFSRPGNGICHQVQLERFGKPGKTLIGSDSHTPTGGGIGMLAFGAGGMDVAVAMGGGAYYITMPKMFKVNLTGALRPYVTAKDISLELLRILSVKGGVGAIIEWGGPGIAALSVPERATITNMGTELGATTSIFPSDDVTRAFLAADTGPDLQHHVLVVIGVTGQQQTLQRLRQPFTLRLGGGQLLLSQFLQLGIGQHLRGGGDIRLRAGVSPVGLCHRRQLLLLTAQLRHGDPVAVYRRVGQLPLHLVQTADDLFQLIQHGRSPDTSARRR